MRNAVSYVPKGQQSMVSAEPRQAFSQPDRPSASQALRHVADAAADVLTHMEFAAQHGSKITPRIHLSVWKPGGEDGSQEARLSGLAPLDLVITMDDAHQRHPPGNPGCRGRGCLELCQPGGDDSGARSAVFVIHDRGAIISTSPKEVPTKVGRRWCSWGSSIAAYSPQVQGRCEPAFRILQDLLPEEPALAGISADVAAANRFLRETYLAWHDARFAIAQPRAARPMCRSMRRNGVTYCASRKSG